jgi:hypothetical protein
MSKTKSAKWMTTALVLSLTATASAVPGYLDQFNARYATAGSVLDTCTVCHGPSGPPLNPYGNDYAAAGHNFAAIESKDSDQDGFANLVEIDARTFPGNARSNPGGGGADTARPVVRGFRIPRIAASLSVPITILTATDDVGVTGYFLSEVKTPVPTAADPGWSASPPTSFTFSSAGKKKLFAWAKDAAGNISRPKKRVVRIKPQ